MEVQFGAPLAGAGLLHSFCDANDLRELPTEEYVDALAELRAR
eukprot:gene47161-8128_t